MLKEVVQEAQFTNPNLSSVTTHTGQTMKYVANDSDADSGRGLLDAKTPFFSSVVTTCANAIKEHKGTLKDFKDRTTLKDTNADVLTNDNSVSNTTIIANVTPRTSLHRPIHVLLVTETWAPDVNGVSMSLGQLMEQIALQGHTVSLLRPMPKQQKTSSSAQATTANLEDTKLKSSNGKPTRHPQFITHEIQVKGMSIPKYSDLQFGLPDYVTIKKTLKQRQPDIVHIATEGPLGLAALLAAKKLNIPATTGYHTQFHDFSRHFGLGILAGPIMAYFKWFHNTSKATCVPSQKTYQDLDKLGFKRLFEVGRGVDLELFNPQHRSDELRQKWGAKKHQTVLIMVSRLSPEKGVDLVIKSFKALQSNQLHRAVKLVIVGDGPDRMRLETLAGVNTTATNTAAGDNSGKNNNSSSDDIIFTGAKTGLALSEHYASGDAFVFASQVETFGNVVVEAMASGLPVYAFDDAAAGMLVTDANGGLATMGDKGAFIDMVAHLPKMQVLKEQGINAAKGVADFSWKRPANHMLDMFHEAINTAAKTKTS